MKKVLFSLFLVAFLMPFASKAQIDTKSRPSVVLDTAVCGSFTWNDILFTHDTTAAYVENDTIHILYLTVWPEYSINMSVDTNCGYRFDRTHAYFATGNYTYVARTRKGCDSIINLNLTISGTSYFGNDTLVGCTNANWRGTRYTRDTAFNYTVAATATGCDSSIALVVNILTPSTAESYDTISACSSYKYTTNTGTRQTFTRSGDIDDVFSFRSVARCLDSTKHVHVIINYPDTTVVRLEDCGSIVYNDVEYTTSVSDKIIKVGRTAQNCDSSISLNLTIHPNPVVTIEGEWQLSEGGNTTLYASCDQQNVAYTWTCNGQTSTADSLVLTNVQNNTDVQLQGRNRQTNCTSTTWLTVTTYLGIEGAESANISLYPNPTVNVLNIESADAINELVIFNAIGQKVMAASQMGARASMDLSRLTNGTYTIRMALENGAVVTKKVIIAK